MGGTFERKKRYFIIAENFTYLRLCGFGKYNRYSVMHVCRQPVKVGRFYTDLHWRRQLFVSAPRLAV